MVKMLVCKGRIYAGPLGTASAGAVITVDEAEAKQLEKSGYAERVDALPKFTQAPAPAREKADDRGVKMRRKATEI